MEIEADDVEMQVSFKDWDDDMKGELIACILEGGDYEFYGQVVIDVEPAEYP